MKNKRTKMELMAMHLLSAVMAFSFWMLNGFYAEASGANIGEMIGTWFLDQLFWLALVALVISVIGCILKRAWIAAGIVGVAGGVALVFVDDPQKLKKIGESIVNNVLQF